MSRHTPGPWTYNGEAIYADRGSYERIAEPSFIISPNSSRDKEVEFNAQLIAAAPRLLVALRGMIEAYELEASADNPALLEARAAYEEATGEKLEAPF